MGNIQKKIREVCAQLLGGGWGSGHRLRICGWCGVSLDVWLAGVRFFRSSLGVCAAVCVLAPAGAGQARGQEIVTPNHPTQAPHTKLETQALGQGTPHDHARTHTESRAQANASARPSSETKTARLTHPETTDGREQGPPQRDTRPQRQTRASEPRKRASRANGPKTGVRPRRGACS